MIKNIIFDLGGVLLNLDTQRTFAAFANLVGDQQIHEQLMRQLAAERVFERFETNELPESEFVSYLQRINPTAVTTADICKAWSAMLLDFPAERLAMLRSLRERGYRVFLLSNINSIHLRDVYAIMETTYQLTNQDFDNLFEKPYYSHLIQQRKPNPATFEYILNDVGLLASETLFIDDIADNVAGALLAGLHAVQHPANSDIAQTVESALNF